MKNIKFFQLISDRRFSSVCNEKLKDVFLSKFKSEMNLCSTSFYNSHDVYSSLPAKTKCSFSLSFTTEENFHPT